MIRSLSILFLLFYFSVNLFSQNFKGEIVDKNDSIIYASTVFIKELKQGVSCNAGRFEMTIPAGVYTVEYKCLGYKSLVHTNVVVSESKTTTEKVILQEKSYNLSEVIVSNGKEDFAYTIMRRAMAKAPFYAKKVKSYTASAYIKGTMVLDKVSKLMAVLAKGDDGVKLSDYKGNLFVQESYNEIKFTAPDKYEQTVKAFSSTIPDNFDSKDVMGLMQSNLYLPNFGEKISPLNPKAFTYYRFRYEGYADEGEDFIYKVKVTPKLKDPQLMSGYIYIADKSWDIRTAELKSFMMGITQNFTISYNKVADSTYLPTSYSVAMEGSILGVGGRFAYHSSLKYVNIDAAEASETEKKVTLKPKKRSFEIKAGRELYKIKSDTLASKRDSSYWFNVRNTPLNIQEKESYIKKDSIQTHFDSVRKKKTNAKFQIGDLFIGGQLGGDSTKVTFNYAGLLGALGDYNFVDGFWLGQRFRLGVKLDSIHRLKIKSSVYYTTARKRVVTDNSVSLNYAPMSLGNITLSGGSTTSDYNPNGITRFDNAFYSLLFGKNKDMLYRKDYLGLSNGIDLTNGLRLTTDFELAKRYGLANNTNYSFFGKKGDAKENFQYPDNSLTKFGIQLEYSPYAYYTISKGEKSYQKITSPTFRLSYSQGIASSKNSSTFSLLEASISQKIKTDEFSSFDYSITGGTFLGSTHSMNFADYKHFNTSNLIVGGKMPNNTFLLLDNYGASTNQYWFVSSFNYSSKYILLKRLPFLQGKLMNEALHFKNLYTPTKKYYSELGYSINLFNVVDMGVYMSLDKLKAKDFGFRINYNLK